MGRSKKNKGNNSNRTQNYDCQRQYKKKKSKAKQIEPYIPSSESELVRRVQSQPGIGSKLVLFTREGQGARHSILFSAAKIKANVTFREVKEDQTKFQLIIDKVVIAEIFTESVIKAVNKDIVSAVALENLQKECFSVVIMTPKNREKVELPSNKKSDLLLNGIGAKIMEKMGWEGKGLGSKQQGRINIVRAQFNVNRQGFGNINNSIKDEVYELLREYSKSNDLNSMAFSTGFTKAERAVVHLVARKLNLRSRSYGEGDRRFTIVENIIHPWELVDKLLEAGGENEQYKLITPTNFL